MVPIFTFLIAHWVLSVFCQTFYLHRYGAHSMFTMSKGWERFFHLLTFVSQGSSYLNPRGYAILHREHHAFSDTPRDPHSPHQHPDVVRMMYATLHRYQGYNHRTAEPEPRFTKPLPPEWKLIDDIGRTWWCHLAFMALYTAFYVHFVPVGSYWLFLFLPIHFVMGPIHGAIVNWCGHMYGYRNFDTTADDKSRNTLVFDFVTMGELFQNNHHKFGMSPNFAARKFEVDPTYPIIKVLNWLGVIQLGPHPQYAHYPA